MTITIFAGINNLVSHQQPGNGIGFIAAISQNLSAGGYVQDIQDD